MVRGSYGDHTSRLVGELEAKTVYLGQRTVHQGGSPRETDYQDAYVWNILY